MSSYGLWLSAAGMKIHEHRQTLLANNMANASTTGFKQDLAVITQRAVESQAPGAGFRFSHPVLDDLPGGLNVRPTYQDFSQGSTIRTGKPLDVAIEGEGFLSVSDGQVTRYTRNGQFAINTTGELVLSSGNGRWRVLDDGGVPIVVNQAAGPVKISQNGTVRQGEIVVGKLGLLTTEDKQSLRKVGENLFDAEGVEMTPVEGRFRPESREESNFNVMRGLVMMIESARAYQLNATLIQLQDQMTAQAVSTVGRVA